MSHVIPPNISVEKSLTIPKLKNKVSLFVNTLDHFFCCLLYMTEGAFVWSKFISNDGLRLEIFLPYPKIIVSFCWESGTMMSKFIIVPSFFFTYVSQTATFIMMLFDQENSQANVSWPGIQFYLEFLLLCMRLCWDCDKFNSRQITEVVVFISVVRIIIKIRPYWCRDKSRV